MRGVFLFTSSDIDGRVKDTVVLCMVVVDHLEKVGVVTRAEGLVEGTVEGLAREGRHLFVVAVIVSVMGRVSCWVESE